MSVHCSAATPSTSESGSRHFEHSVQFYEQDSFLVEAVGRFAGQALAAGDSAVIVATALHREMLAEELSLRGLDLAQCSAEGRYITLDAASVLAEFTIDGWPQPARFRATIAPLLEQARAAARGRGQLSVFGEMVALLWAEGKRNAAVRLEQLWNELAETQSFSLFCAYPLAGFERDEHQRMFFNICGEHSQVNPAEGYAADGNEESRRRSVAELQRKTRALTAEIRLSQERVLLLQNATAAGTWELDLADDTLSLSSKAARLLGLPSGQLPISALIQQVRYSGDRTALYTALAGARKRRKGFVTEFRFDRGGETRVFSIRGRTLYNNGHSLVLGIISDITPEVASDASRETAA